jgi:leader peptidase (prepilin peptidase) / N-methyltransferase
MSPETIQTLTPGIVLFAYIAVFLGATVSDLKTKTIPITYVYSLIILSLIFFPPELSNLTWQAKALGALVGTSIMGIQYLLTKGKGLGSGDILITLSIGFLLGWQKTLVALFIAYLLGASYGIVLLKLKKAKGKTKVAFIPFLFFGTLTSLIWGQALLEWYTSLL